MDFCVSLESNIHVYKVNIHIKSFIFLVSNCDPWSAEASLFITI